MPKGLLLALAGLFISGLVAFTESDLEELTGRNFHQKISELDDQKSLVMFYAPWCGHCKDTKPHFFRAAKTMSEQNDHKNKKFFLLNCETPGNQDVCSKEMIEGYPTIKLYEGDKLVEEYFDENMEAAFVKYMTNPPKYGEGRPANGAFDASQQTNAPDILMDNVLNVNAQNFSLIKDYKQVLVFFYAPWCPHCTEMKPKFSEAGKLFYVAKEAKKQIFASMNCDLRENEDLCSEEKVDGFPTIRYYKNGEAWAEYEEDFSVDAFAQYFDKTAPKEKQKILTLKERFPTDKKDDSKAIEGDSNKPKFDWGAVDQIASDKDYKSIVKSSSNGKASLVMFYAPWCPHCVQYKPHFIDAAKALKSERNLIEIVGMYAVDCDTKTTEQTCTEENITGYPSVVLFDKAGMKLKEMSTGLKSKGEIMDFFRSSLHVVEEVSAKTDSSFEKDEL